VKYQFRSKPGKTRNLPASTDSKGLTDLGEPPNLYPFRLKFENKKRQRDAGATMTAEQD